MSTFRSISGLALAGFVGWAWVTHKPTQAQQSQVQIQKPAVPKYSPPAMPAAVGELPPSVMPEILRRVGSAKESAKPKFDARGKQIFDFTSIPMNPQPGSKTDILGFRIAMPRSEVDARFQEIGCKPKQESMYGRYAYSLECKFAAGEKLKMHLVKGVVSDRETEVVKYVDLIFDSNDGALKTIDAVSRQFRSLPVFFGDDLQVRRIQYCAPGVRPQYACSQGELARWPLTSKITLELTLNSAADDELKKPDSYWLQMTFDSFDDLEAEKALKSFGAQNRTNIPSPRF